MHPPPPKPSARQEIFPDLKQNSFKRYLVEGYLGVTLFVHPPPRIQVIEDPPCLLTASRDRSVKLRGLPNDHRDNNDQTMNESSAAGNGDSGNAEDSSITAQINDAADDRSVISIVTRGEAALIPSSVPASTTQENHAVRGEEEKAENEGNGSSSINTLNVGSGENSAGSLCSASSVVCSTSSSSKVSRMSSKDVSVGGGGGARNMGMKNKCCLSCFVLVEYMNRQTETSCPRGILFPITVLEYHSSLSPPQSELAGL